MLCPTFSSKLHEEQLLGGLEPCAAHGHCHTGEQSQIPSGIWGNPSGAGPLTWKPFLLLFADSPEDVFLSHV